LSKIALTSALLPQAFSSNLCMDVPDTGVDPLDGDVQIWGCNGQPNQQWDVDDLYIKDAQHDYCLALPDGDTTNRKRVQLQDGCPVRGSLFAQGWTFDGWSSHIRYKADPSKCLDAGDMQAGFALMIWDCSDLPQQKWGYDADAQTIYLIDSWRLQASTSAAQTNMTAQADEDLGSSNLTAQAEENLTAQREGNLTAQADEDLGSSNLTAQAEEDMTAQDAGNLTAQAEENLSAQAQDNLIAQAEEDQPGNPSKALRDSLLSARG
jgi:hypothetical protein